MANIFKAKEIYKRLPGVSPSDNPLRAIRGLYVVGHLKTPYLIPSGIQITNIGTRPATVVDYIETSYTRYPGDDDCNSSVLDFETSTRLNVTRYTTSSYTRYPGDDDCNSSVLDFETSVGLNVTKYQTNYYTRYPGDDDCNSSVLDFETSRTFDITRYYTASAESTPEPLLRIKSIESTQATITNEMEG